MCTGVDGAIGTKWIACENVKCLGILGTGAISSMLLPFHLVVRRFELICCHAVRQEDSSLSISFAKEMKAQHDVEVVPVPAVKELILRSDVLVSSTYATSTLPPSIKDLFKRGADPAGGRSRSLGEVLDVRMRDEKNE